VKERFWGGGTHGLRAVRLAVLVMAAGMSLVPLGSVGPAFATALTSPTSAAHLPRTPPTTTAPLAPDIKEGPDAVQLLSQTPWAGPEQASFQLELQITASDPGAESLGVFVYGALTARSEFQAALGGQVSNFLYAPSTGPVPLRSLVRGPGGGAEVDIPLSTLSLTTGVYPVQVFLEKDGIRVGQPLTTFLVFAGKDAVHLKALRASFVLPIAAEVSVDPRTGATAPLPSQEAQALQAASAVLAAARAPVTLAADVPTLEALQRSGYTGQDALADLRAAVKAGDELLPSTAMPVEIPSFVASGLTGDLEGELQEGSKDLVTLLGAAPTMSTWAFPAGTGLATVEALATLGARQVALPGSALSPLPASYQVLTFARPTRL